MMFDEKITSEFDSICEYGVEHFSFQNHMIADQNRVIRNVIIIVNLLLIPATIMAMALNWYQIVFLLLAAGANVLLFYLIIRNLAKIAHNEELAIKLLSYLHENEEDEA